MKNKYFLFLIILIALSCKKGREMKTDSGFKYILFTESKNPKIQLGNYVTMVMTYRNSDDSVLYDSNKSGGTIRFRLEKIPFPGSYEEGLTYLSENDSARFFVPADSLYNYLYKPRGADVIPQNETGLKPGTMVVFDIRVLKVQTETEAEEEMMLEESKKEKEETASLQSYLQKRGISVQPEPAGYYLILQQSGTGLSVDSGRLITVEYEGRFLNDSVFDGTQNAGRPYKFISGSHHVIPGWEMAMKKLRAGDKFTLLVPSRLAYGAEGIRDPKSGNAIIPPYTPLVFDIEILSVEDVPAVSGR